MGGRKITRKAIIAIVVAVVLLATAITLTVVFLRNSGESSAAIAQEGSNRTTGTDADTSDSNDSTNDGIVGTPEDSTQNTSSENNTSTGSETGDSSEGTGTSTSTGSNTSSSASTSSSTGSTGTSTQEVVVEETEEVEKKVSEDLNVSWQPLSVSAILSEVSNLTINKPIITGVKTNDLTKKIVKPGDTFSYYITLTNSGTLEGTTKVEDNVPVQLEIIEATGATIVGNTVTWDSVTVGLVTPVVLEIKVKVKVDATGTITNTATVGKDDITDPTPIDTVNITGVKANTLTNKIVKPEDTFKYTITLTNSGTIKGNTTVVDTVPSQLSIEKATGATIVGNVVTWADVEVTPGTPVVLEIEVKVKADATGTITNTATVGGTTITDPDPVDTVNITGVKANTLTNKTVKPGDTFKYTITLTNSGTIKGNTTVVDTVPSQLSIEKATGATIVGNVVTWADVEVTPGTPVVLEIEVKVKADATGTITNTATVGKDDITDPTPIDTVNITGVKANTLTNKIVKPEDTFKYTITLTNSGTIKGNTTVVDTIPSQLSIEKATGATIVGNVVTWADVEVTPGTPVVLEIEVKVKADATGTITNTATVGGTTITDPDPVDTVNITGVKANTLTNKIVKPGDTFKYTITLTNSGTIKGNTTVVDTVPSQLSIEKATGATIVGNVVTWANVEVTPGTPVVLEIEVKVKADATGTITNTATVGETTITDPDPVDTVNIKATKTSEVLVERTPAGTVYPEDTIVYTIKVWNIGTKAKTITVTDDILQRLSAKVSLVDGSISASSGGVSVDENIITWGVRVPENTIEANALTLTFSVKVKAGATGSIGNTAVVDGENATDDSTYTVKKPANITVNKTSAIVGKPGVTTVEPGDKILYTITATNTGELEGSVTIKETVPTGTSLIRTGTTNLSVSELNDLESAQGLEKVLKVAPNGGTATITFTVEVTANAGSTIANTIDTTGDNGNGTTTTTNKVEKTVTVTEKTESLKGTNIVLVIDTSGSMADKVNGVTKLELAKQEAKNLVDSVFPNASTDAKGSTITVVEFYSQDEGFIFTKMVDYAVEIGSAGNYTQAASLKTKIGNLSSGGGTPVAAGLNKASSILSSLNNGNENVVILLGDGMSEDCADTNYTAAANSVKSKAELYTIGFGIEENSNAENMLKGVATSTSYYYNTRTASLADVFSAIVSKIMTESDPVQSSSGKIAISSDIDVSTHGLEIYVNGATTPTYTITDLDNDSNGVIVKENGIYKVDLTKFNATDTIKIDYFVK